MSISANFPDTRPTLILDFANTGSLDPRVTFSRASSGSYFDQEGILKTAGAGIPRFDHDPATGHCKGLMIEEQRTNLLTWSEDFTNGVWIGSDRTVTGNQAIAPDGMESADLVSITAPSGDLRSQNLSLSSATYTFSFYAKSETGSDIDADVSIVGGDGATVAVTQTLTFTGEWQRFSVSGAAVSGSSGRVQIGGGNPLSGEAFYLWGAQLEAGERPTSYIKTEGSQVTRAADSATFSGTAFSDLYNPTQGTWVVDAFDDVPIDTSILETSNGFKVFTYDSTPNMQALTYKGDTVSDSFTLKESTQKVSYYPITLGHRGRNSLVSKEPQENLTLVIETTSVNETFQILTADNGVFDAVIDWDDGSPETPVTSWDDPDLSHVYAEAGIYAIKIKGSFGAIYYNNNAQGDKILGIYNGDTALNGVTDLTSAFWGLNNLRHFSANIDFSNVTVFPYCWRDCSSLESFPLIDTSNMTSFYRAWYGCSSLKSFPLLDSHNALSFTYAWWNCSSLTDFPALNSSKVTSFFAAWEYCNGLKDFPSLDVSNVASFVRAWRGCTSLTSQSVENILTSIDTSGTSGPATGNEITIDYDTGTGGLSNATVTAIENLMLKGWAVRINGVLYEAVRDRSGEYISDRNDELIVERI